MAQSTVRFEIADLILELVDRPGAGTEGGSTGADAAGSVDQEWAVRSVALLARAAPRVTLDALRRFAADLECVHAGRVVRATLAGEGQAPSFLQVARRDALAIELNASLSAVPTGAQVQLTGLNVSHEQLLTLRRWAARQRPPGQAGAMSCDRTTS